MGIVVAIIIAIVVIVIWAMYNTGDESPTQSATSQSTSPIPARSVSVKTRTSNGVQIVHEGRYNLPSSR